MATAWKSENWFFYSIYTHTYISKRSKNFCRHPIWGLYALQIVNFSVAMRTTRWMHVGLRSKSHSNHHASVFLSTLQIKESSIWLPWYLALIPDRGKKSVVINATSDMMHPCVLVDLEKQPLVRLASLGKCSLPPFCCGLALSLC